MSKYLPKPTNPFVQKLQEKKQQLKPWERSQQKLNELEITDQFFKNEHGCYRWKNIRSAYFNDFIDLDRVVDLSKKWKTQNEYLWLEAVDTATNEIVGNFFFKCAKRGNDVYKSRLKERFSFLENLDPIYYFLDNQKQKYSPMLFVTLTVAPKRYSLDTAWQKISAELHLFESKLRQAYGSFVKFRVWESHESGYPHTHIVYYFHDKWFKVFKHKDRYRIPTKHLDKISKFWSMGNVDIQAVQDTHGAFSEVQKYITKNIWSDKGDLTNALICLYRKQMYSLSRCDPFLKRLWYFQKHNITDWRDQERIFMSKLKEWSRKDFIGAIWGSQIYFQFYKECGSLAEPGAATLVKDFVHNCNIENIKFRYIGCVAASDLATFAPNADEDWILCADPPPEFKYLIGFDTDLYSLKDL